MDKAKGKIKSSYINNLIKNCPDSDNISDGYHTFGELYKHRTALFQAFMNMMNEIMLEKEGWTPCWKSRLHSDGTCFTNMFVAGIGEEKGNTYTYHVHNSYWGMFDVPEIERAPEYDGHTSDDVLKFFQSLNPMNYGA